MAICWKRFYFAWPSAGNASTPHGHVLFTHTLPKHSCRCQFYSTCYNHPLETLLLRMAICWKRFYSAWPSAGNASTSHGHLLETLLLRMAMCWKCFHSAWPSAGNASTPHGHPLEMVLLCMAVKFTLHGMTEVESLKPVNFTFWNG